MLNSTKSSFRSSLILLASFSITSVAAVSACGAKSSASNPEFRCNSGSDNSVDFRRPHFVTRQLAGQQIDGASVLYRLNSQTMQVEPIVIRGSDSSDSWALRDTRQDEMLLLERFTSKPQSRLTRLGCENGGRKREVGDLPDNTFGLGYLNNEILIALGWNDSVYAALRPDFSRATATNSPPINKLTVAGNALGLTSADVHFNSLLVRNDTPFVLSTGYSLSTFIPTQTKLLKLDNLMQETLAAYDVPACKNAYQDFTLQTGPNEIFLGCNPQYAGAVANQEVRLVSVALTQTADPEFKVFGVNANNEAQIIRPGGVSKDKLWVFVTEQTTSTQTVDANPGKFLRSYWLNKKTGEQINMNGISGDVIFDEVERNYIFSCVVSVDLKCRKNTFAILPEADFANPAQAEFRAADFMYDFFHFERPIF